LAYSVPWGSLPGYVGLVGGLGFVECHTVFAEYGGNTQVVYYDMTALYKYAGLNNREIGEILEVDYSTVSQEWKRLRDKVEKERKNSQLLKRIDKELSGVRFCPPDPSSRCRTFTNSGFSTIL